MKYWITFISSICLHLSFVEPAECVAYFSPKDHLGHKLVALIDREEKQIQLAAYAIGYRDIAEALMRAQNRGVKVEVLVDPAALKKSSSVGRLLKSHVPLFVWDLGKRRSYRARATMHDTFCIFGNHLVWTGSFQFTRSSDQFHQENVVLIDSLEIAKEYAGHFSYMKIHESCPYSQYALLYPEKSRRKKR